MVGKIAGIGRQFNDRPASKLDVRTRGDEFLNNLLLGSDGGEEAGMVDFVLGPMGLMG